VTDLFGRLRALVRADVDFERAERALRADVERRQQRSKSDSGERHRAEKRETAERLGLEETHYLAREQRLGRWMGWDVAPPVDDDE
jgi:hypothetical protein